MHCVFVSVVIKMQINFIETLFTNTLEYQIIGGIGIIGGLDIVTIVNSSGGGGGVGRG